MCKFVFCKYSCTRKQFVTDVALLACRWHYVSYFDVFFKFTLGLECGRAVDTDLR